MEKKLTAQGPKDRKSYMVTLPIDWIKSRNLNKSRIVDMELIGNTIVITPPSESKEQIKIEADHFKRVIDRVLAGLYIMGIDEIKINYKDSKLLNKIIQVIKDRMLGFEILEHSKNYLIIKSITKESNEEFKNILRRIFLLQIFLSEEILKFIKDKKTNESYEIVEYNKSLIRLANFCQRLLMKKGHVEYNKVPFYFSLCEELKQLANVYKWIYNDIILFKDKKTNLEYILIKLNNNLKSLYNLFYSFNIDDYEKNRAEIFSLYDKLIKKRNKYSYYTISMVVRLNALYKQTFYIKFNPENQ